MSRRGLLRWTAATALASSPCLSAMAGDPERRFPIAACDWSLGRAGSPAALELASQIGLDGVEVSFGKPVVPFDLRLEENRRKYQQTARTCQVEIASLGMATLNQVPYASEPQAESWVQDSVDVLAQLGVKVALLAFFGAGDILEKPRLQAEVIRRLKRVAPRAERAGVVLGIESWLNADQHVRILDAVGSPAVQVYYDVANMHKQGYDICREIRQLSRERICQIHCKENGSLLGQGPIDFVQVKRALDDIGYADWLVIESAMGQGMTVLESYRHNQKYLRSVFS
jgi:sugar phosphate isomerase/epimerase